MSDTPPPVGFNLWLAPTKPGHSVTNVRCWGKFWGQYKAKDKTARIFQYFARVLVVYYGKDSDWGGTWWTLSQNASLARSCFRLFRWIDEFVTAWDTVRSNSSGAMYLFSSIRAITIGTFILMNNLFWALNWKLLRFTSAANMKNWASYVRLVAESSGFIWMLLKYSEASNKRAKAVKNLDVKGAAAATEAKTAAVYKAIVFFCNFSTYSDISGLYPATIGGGKAMSQVVFGVLGTISALCGMREPWMKSEVKA